MNQIKFEMDNKMCVGCLSVDRKLIKLNSYSELYFNLLGEQYPTELKCLKLELCWECVALLHRIHRFQRRIQDAQIILQSIDHLNKRKLSNLTKEHKDYYDLTIEYEEEKMKTIDFGISKEIDISKVIKEEDLEEIKEENEEVVTEDDRYSDIDECDRDESLIKKENAKKRVCKRKCAKSVKITKNDIDVYNIEKYFIGEMSKSYVEQKIVRKSSSDSFSGQCDNYDSVCATAASVTHLHGHTPVWRCKLCGTVCRTRTEQCRHLKYAHEKNYTCVICGCCYNTMRDFGKHYKEMHQQLICDYCGKKFIKRRSIETHIRRNHTPLVCRECNRTYATYHALDNHNRMCHPEMPSAHSELAYCVECDKQYPSVYKYRRHLATGVKHRAPKKQSVPCPDCGKVFSRRAYMNNHYRLFHTKKSKHHCELCDKYFITGYSLRKHKAYVHEKILQPRNKMCNVCGRGFSTNRVLVNHMRTHTGERPYSCAHCGSAFAQHTALKTHIRALHKNVTS